MESLKKGETLIPTPRWFIGVRVVQIIVSLVIVALSGYLIHGYYADPQGIAIASGIFTWIIAAYAILTEHSAACRPGYNTWAILSLDFFMIVLWLASLGANAAYRASFVVPVTADCYNDGSAVNSNHCIVYKRAAVTGPTGRAAISAIAGVSAIMLLLFVATFAYVAHYFRLEWAKHSSDVEKVSGADAPAAVPVGQTQAFVTQQQPQWAQQQHQPSAYPTPTTPYDPYAAPAAEFTPQSTGYTAQSSGYGGAQGAYNPAVPQQVPHELNNTVPQHHPHELPSPQGTPAPGQQYYSNQ